MPKAKEKMVPIRVTARFEVTFTHRVTETQFKELDAGNIDIEDVVDETIPYAEAATSGDCEMEWDYSAPARPLKKSKPKAKKK